MRALLDLLVPSRCDGCGARAAPPWCDACEQAVRAARPQVPCPRCAAGDAPGHPCWTDGAPVATMVALTAWRDPAATALLRAKLRGRAEVFAALGPVLAGLVGDRVTATVDGVVPVPTDPRRVRDRGADHTRVLARALGRELDVPVRRAVRVGRRIADRGSAVSDHRARVPTDAFVPTPAAEELRGTNVLVVDDVVTTGGTIAAVAGALRGAGVPRVHVAVLARAGQHPLVGAEVPS